MSVSHSRCSTSPLFFPSSGAWPSRHRRATLDVFADDYVSSPAHGGEGVPSHSANGRIGWKEKVGTTLKAFLTAATDEEVGDE